MKWITPTLVVVGDEWPAEDIRGASEAVEWITAARGESFTNIAFVADDNVAREVLAGLGLGAAEVDERISFANGMARAALITDADLYGQG